MPLEEVVEEEGAFISADIAKEFGCQTHLLDGFIAFVMCLTTSRLVFSRRCCLHDCQGVIRSTFQKFFD